MHTNTIGKYGDFILIKLLFMSIPKINYMWDKILSCLGTLLLTYFKGIFSRGIGNISKYS